MELIKYIIKNRLIDYGAENPRIGYSLNVLLDGLHKLSHRFVQTVIVTFKNRFFQSFFRNRSERNIHIEMGDAEILLFEKVSDVDSIALKKNKSV